MVLQKHQVFLDVRGVKRRSNYRAVIVIGRNARRSPIRLSYAGSFFRLFNCTGRSRPECNVLYSKEFLSRSPDESTGVGLQD